MKELLSKYLQSKVRISQQDLDDILDCFQQYHVPAHRHLSKRGQILDKYYFVESGGLRFYTKQDRLENTAWFAFENDFFTDLLSYQRDTPSQFYIQAMEETTLYGIKKIEMEKLFDRFPIWERLVRKVWEDAFIRVVNGVLNFQTMNAKERYLNLMQHTDLLEKVPLKYLASFLGITDTSLSRLRKEIQ